LQRLNPHEPLLSPYLQGLFATSILLALSQQSLSKAESSVPKAAKSSIWQLGIGADPTQLLWETKTSPDVQELVQAWSPDFLAGWLNSFDHRQGI